MLLTLCAFAIIQQKTGTLKPLILQSDESSAWKLITGKTGVVFSAPTELGEPKSTGPDLTHTTAETYTPAAWMGTTISVSRTKFGKEDPEDSEATKLEDVIYNDIDVEENPVSSIHFRLQQGWPQLNLEGKKKDGTPYRYLVCRTKNENFMFSVTGKTLPAPDVLNKMFDSFQIPAETGTGSATKIGPEAGDAKLSGGLVELWSPVALKRSDDSFNENGASGEEYEGGYGYSTYRIVVIKCPENMVSLVTEEALDEFIKQSVEEECEGDKVPTYPIKLETIGGVHFRTAAIRDGTTDGKVAVSLKGNILIMCAAWVPHGLIDCEDVKHLFSSIRMK